MCVVTVLYSFWWRLSFSSSDISSPWWIAAATSSRLHGFTCSASDMLLEIPMNSDRTSGLRFVRSWAMMNSIEVVFMPSRRGVITPRSATDKRA